jgi:hypothetical protein
MRESDGTTTLYGPVTDRAALRGLSARVRDLGVTLISVHATGDPGHIASTHKPTETSVIPRSRHKEN